MMDKIIYFMIQNGLNFFTLYFKKFIMPVRLDVWGHDARVVNRLRYFYCNLSLFFCDK